jgi:hypothetical protein
MFDFEYGVESVWNYIRERIEEDEYLNAVGEVY